MRRGATGSLSACLFCLSAPQSRVGFLVPVGIPRSAPARDELNDLSRTTTRTFEQWGRQPPEARGKRGTVPDRLAVRAGVGLGHAHRLGDGRATDDQRLSVRTGMRFAVHDQQWPGRCEPPEQESHRLVVLEVRWHHGGDADRDDDQELESTFGRRYDADRNDDDQCKEERQTDHARTDGHREVGIVGTPPLTEDRFGYPIEPRVTM